MIFFRFSYLMFLIFLIGSCTKPQFELISSDISGIDFNNEIVDKDTFNILRNEYMYNGGGVGIADLNNDTLPDIILAGNKVSTRIYLNMGRFHFQDISANFEGLSDKQWISGISIVDINSDGFIDLYFTSTQSLDSTLRKNQLWVNQGLKNQMPFFKEMAAEYGIADQGHSMHSAFLDYDLDGDLDLYILNNIVNKQVPTNYRPKVTDGSASNNDKFYKNLGNGKFVNITNQAGIVYEGYGLGVAVGDVNKDGYPDLYISNDYVSNDLFYINQRDGTFKNKSKEYLSYQSRFSMGNDMADVNNDGNLDIITMDMMPEQYFRKKQTINGNSYFLYINNEKYGYEPQYIRNMLQMHNGFQNSEMVPFSELGQMMGVYQTEWSWSPLFADYDNDGDKDLLITNGYPRDLTDKDFTNYKAGMAGSLLSDEALIKEIPIVKVSNYAFRQVDGTRFEDVTKAWGLFKPSFSNGAAFVDLDIDGDLDYVVNNINDLAFVYRNNSIENDSDQSHFIQIALVGEEQNTLAIGAKVEIWVNGKYQYAEKNLSRGYISSVDPMIHFGLGDNEQIDSIIVTWPTARHFSRVVSIKANSRLTLYEKDAEPIGPVSTISQRTLFSSSCTLDYVHSQTDYVDFFHGQNILQHKFSQVGPVMASGDFTNDGIPELIIGATDNQPTEIFQLKGDTLVRIDMPGLSEKKRCHESDFAIVDIDGDNDNDVISLSGGYDVEDASLYQHFLFRNEGKEFVKELLPIDAFPASVVRPFDYDKDGDIDLFIGARVSKGKFPYASNSYILTNVNGSFFKKPESTFDLGMVTDAVWTDINVDGFVDLLISREWNSLVPIMNLRGQQFTIGKQKGFEKVLGLWSCLVAADFDKDGDDDYIVGNLGENHRFFIDEKHPLSLYAVDLDKNGSIDPLVTSFWKDKEGEMQEYPVNYLDELNAQSPFFRKKFTSYTTFSYSTIAEIISTDSIKTKLTVNTTSSYILWNNDNLFRWEKLPAPAQVAPIKKFLVYDFNADGNLDVLVGGNDFSHDVSTGYYDANRGVVMLGTGLQTFSVLPTNKTGLAITGQVESLVLLPTEKPTLIVGINRRKAQVYRLSGQ